MSNLLNRALFIWVTSLHYWNVDGYDLGYRSQYIDDEGIQYTGMRTEQAAIWLIERKEECLENIVAILEKLGANPMKIVSERDYLDQFIDTRKLTDRDIKLLTKQIKDYQSRDSHGSKVS